MIAGVLSSTMLLATITWAGFGLVETSLKPSESTDMKVLLVMVPIVSSVFKLVRVVPSS